MKFSIASLSSILCFLCSLSYTTVEGQLSANFSADSRQGCNPLVVRQFSDLSSGNPSKWFWDFGNGNTSTQKSPSAIYFDPGSYPVKLVVEDATGAKDSITKDNFIVVNSTPVVNFTSGNTTGCVPFTVQFADQSSGVSGSIKDWQWDFGDGGTSVEQAPSHTFAVTGDFAITLKVRNTFGCEDVKTKSSYIHVNSVPKASFASVTAAVCNPPVQVNFSNTSTGGPITTSEWSFGDGAISSATSPSHIYTSPGTYQVTLVVANQNGCIDSVSQTTVIQSVNQSFTAPDNVCQGVPVNFSNTSSPAVSSAFWDFGDNTSSSGLNPVKSFATAGIFIVKLVNNFGRCIDSISRKITVLPKPTVDFTVLMPASICKMPANVSFTSNAAAAISYTWNFGDGTNSTVPSPTHSYVNYGSFAVKLTVAASNGCSDSITKQNAVSLVPAKINSFVNLPFNGCVPHQQTFSANTTSPEAITSYLWNFGDGNTSTAANPVHNYNAEGSYDVSLKITTVNGCTDAFTLPASIAIVVKPTANFSATPRVACGYQQLQFTDLSTGKIAFRKWEFGDGKTSDSINPSHRYSDTGFFSVKLIVGSLSCYDTLIIPNYVYINPPIAKFTVGLSCDVPLSRHFQNNSILARASEWSFGDGSAISTDTNPDHAYAKPGTYIVHLHVTNSNCYDDFADTIQVIDEHPDFTINKNILCRNDLSVFTVINITTPFIATYTWDFGDNTPPVAVATPGVSHTYTGSGVFSPALTVTDNLGCVRKVEHISGISIYGPKADFLNPRGACLNTNVPFVDNSKPSVSFPIISSVFDYGDSHADTIKTSTFSHVYTIPKKYNLSLIVTDSYGCKDTLFKPAAISITNSKAGFSVKDSILCNNSTVSFINQSIGDSLTYLWNFGDGATADTAAPSHTFSSQGNYAISLTIKDTSGCVDSIKKTNAVVIANAKASFALSDSVISCPPAQINFTNKSTYSTSVKWNFDDGNSSGIANPSHYFLSAATYHVKLTAYGYGSCVDSTVKDIIVKGPNGSFTYNPLLKCVPAPIQFTETANNNNSNVNITWDFGDGTVTTTFASAISHTYASPGKFLPKVLLVDTSLNCRVSILGSDTISITGAISYIKSYKNLFCDSASVQFFDSSKVKNDTIAGYNWTFGDGAISSAQNPIHNYAAPGIYPVSLTVKTTAGCTSSSSNTAIKVVKSPQLQVSGPSATCVNQPVQYTGAVQDTSKVKWTWDFNNGNNSVFPFPLPQTYAAAGTYSINTSVTNSSGCTTAKTTVLTVNPLPNVDAGPDSIICRGATITLHPSGADSYVWQSSPSLTCTTCTNPVASPVDTSVYYLVTGTNALTSCQKTDSVQVKVVQLFKIAAIPLDTLCVGETVQLWATGADSFTWSPPTGLSNPNIPNPVASPGTTTLYTVTGHDYRNCFTDVATVPITVYPIPVFNIPDHNVTIAVGSSVTIKTKSSADIISWQWFPTTGLSCSTCPEPVSTPSNTIIYKASVANQGGCKAEDRITINVFCNNGNIFIPNTFSPNNDGSNDIFYPRGKGIAGVKNFQVFSKWGSLVFQKSNFSVNDSRSGWDGTFNGKPLDADVFVYQVEVICETGQVFSFKGDITLIR